MAISGQLTTRRNQRKTQHQSNMHTKRLRIHSRTMHKQNCISISWNALANLANGDCSIFDNLRVRNCHPIKFLKGKIRPIKFERFFTRKHVCVLTLCTGVKIQNFGESKIMKSLTYGFKLWKYRYLNVLFYMYLNLFSKSIRYIFTDEKIR